MAVRHLWSFHGAVSHNTVSSAYSRMILGQNDRLVARYSSLTMNDRLVFEQDFCCISDNLKTSHDVNIVPEQSSTSFNTVIPPVLCIFLVWYFRA